MKQYLNLLDELLREGNNKCDRTGTGTVSKFGHQMRFNLQDGFPIVTTKKMFTKGVIEELLWFVKGSVDVKDLQSVGVNFWNSWQDETGTIGHGYGKQLRNIESYVAVVPKVFDASEAANTDDATSSDVGYLGEPDHSDPYYKILKATWDDMIRRCYCNKRGNYSIYGARGVHVEKSWHSFSNFQRDAKLIPGWSLKIEYPHEYSLDKDILWASNRYGKETCMWASNMEQQSNQINCRAITGTSPDGEVILFPSVRRLCDTHMLDRRAVKRVAKGEYKQHLGWSDFTYLEAPSGHVIRYRKIDQLKQVIAEIKHNPNSRRLIIALWNPQDIDRTTLPPCHGNLIQFYVFDGRLSCLMVQRSCDIFLGVPVNIASYALLTHMIAHQCDLQVGEFIWSGNDVHLYLNHLEKAKLQLTREPYPLPTLNIKRKPESIFDYKFDDFELVNYQAHPHIKAPISV